MKVRKRKIQDEKRVRMRKGITRKGTRESKIAKGKVGCIV